MELTQIEQMARKLKSNIAKVIVGKEEVVDLMLIALISSGHVLLEDVPGTGKTLLAKTLAQSLHCSFKRVQFTPDLLPSDISGIHYYNQKIAEFIFRPGPLFANIVLADEINRATPRTQSVLLECMEERQVSIDGETHPLSAPFMVIATQNPVEHQGTFPLPEAQMDRFLLKISMGYPTTTEAVNILQRFKTSHPLQAILPVVEQSELIAAQQSYANVKVSEDLLQYLIQIIEKTRTHPDIALGVSPRGSQALLKAVQVYAILHSRDYVLPDDIKAMFKPVCAHRILLRNKMRMDENQTAFIMDKIMAETAVPTETLLV